MVRQLSMAFLWLLLGGLLLALGQSTEKDKPPEKQENEPKGQLEGVYAIICVQGGRCLDAYRPDVDKNGAVIQSWRYSHTSNQQWEIKPVDADRKQFKIVSVASGKVLDLKSDEQDENGATIQLWEYLGNANQHWELSHQSGMIYVIKNCASGKVLDFHAYQTDRNQGKIQAWDSRETPNQQWVLVDCADEKATPRSPKPSGSLVETLSPLPASADEMQILWTDPERQEKWPQLKPSDLVRFEYPGARKEIAWSSKPGDGGMEALAIPRPDLVYRVYRRGKPDEVPRFVAEVPLVDKGDEARNFWRARDKSMMAVPLFFVGLPADGGKKINLDDTHKDLSVAVLASPFDWAVVLSSKEVLIVIRARLTRQQEWVAVELHMYNVYGPAVEAPPQVFVRMAGGVQLTEFLAEDANKIIPDNLTFGEYESVTQTHTVGVEAHFTSPIGLGGGVHYDLSHANEKGTTKGYSKVHPLRWELFTKKWEKGALLEGSSKEGIILFIPPQAKPSTGTTGATIILRTPRRTEFAHLRYQGTPTPDLEISLPGSAVGSMRYQYLPYTKPETKP